MLITAIEIEGNELISDDEIMAVIGARVGAYVTGEDIKKDLVKIFDMGYFQEQPIAKIPPYKNGHKVIFSVRENAVVKNVRIIGNTIVPTKELRSLITVEMGKVFNANQFRSDLNSIAQHYYDKGYSVGLKNVDFDESTNTLEIEVAEYKVGKVNIAGNEKTKDYVLWREIQTKPGELFNVKKLTEDLRRIYNLGFFEQVSPDIQEGDNYTVDLTYVVQELKTGEADFGAGYSSVDGLFGMIGVNDKNFLGRAYGVQFNWEFGGKKTAYELGFYDPWFGGTRMGFGINLYDRSIKRQEKIGQYEIWRRGFEAGLTKYLDVYTSVSGKYRMEDSSLTPISGSIVAEPRSSLRSVRLSINHDLRDNFLDPTKGYVITGATEFAGGVLGGDSTFTKYELDSSVYLKGWKNHIIALRGVAGYISSRTAVPKQEEFIVGGPNTLRAYDYGKFRGDKMIVLNGEYRIPLADALQGVIFVDAGRAWTREESMDLQDLVVGAGVGVRLKLPIGLIIRVDFGYGEDGTKTSFNLGQSF